MEKRIGTLEQVKGHTYDTIYDLLFTTERIIALIIEHPTDVPFKFGITELFIGGKLSKQMDRPERMRVAEERRHIYKEKTFDELINFSRFNFEIPYRLVTEIEISKGIFQSHLRFHLAGSNIKTHTIQFTITKVQAQKARDFINQVTILMNKMK